MIEISTSKSLGVHIQIEPRNESDFAVDLAIALKTLLDASRAQSFLPKYA